MMLGWTDGAIRALMTLAIIGATVLCAALIGGMIWLVRAALG